MSQSIEQFRKDALTLRQNWGQKQFWENESKVKLALKGFMSSYMITEGATPEEQEHIITLFDSTLQEFMHRATLMRLAM